MKLIETHWMTYAPDAPLNLSNEQCWTQEMEPIAIYSLYHIVEGLICLCGTFAKKSADNPTNVNVLEHASCSSQWSINYTSIDPKPDLFRWFAVNNHGTHKQKQDAAIPKA